MEDVDLMWIQLKQSVFTHRKTVAVAEALDMEEVHVVGHLGALWTWALDNASDDGVIDASVRTIEKAAYWGGARGAFVAALVEAGYLHVVDGGYSVHAWDTHIGALLEKRAANAARQQAYRDRTRAARVTSQTQDPAVTRDVTVTCELRNDEDKIREDKRRQDDTPLPPRGDVGADPFDPTGLTTLPPRVTEALEGCPAHWGAELERELAIKRAEEPVVSPVRYCLAILKAWKQGDGAPQPPAPPRRDVRPAPVAKRVRPGTPLASFPDDLIRSRLGLPPDAPIPWDTPDGKRPSEVAA